MTNNAVSSTNLKPSGKNSAVISAWIITVMTLLALLSGWLIKSSIQNRVQVIERSGVRAEFPAGWHVELGLQDEEFVFGGSDPLDPTLSYSVNLMPVTPEMQVNDLVITRNLERGQKLSNFKVLDQTPVVLSGKDAYRVHFAYVLPGKKDQLPQVIQGLDYIFFSQPRAMIVTMEEETYMFKDAQPLFTGFLSKVTMPGGD